MICFSICTTMFINLSRNTKGLESLTELKYENTSELFNYQQNFYIGLSNLLKYKNEEYIKQGNTIDKEEFERRKQNMFFDWYSQINQQIGNGYDKGII